MGVNKKSGVFTDLYVMLYNSSLFFNNMIDMEWLEMGCGDMKDRDIMGNSSELNALRDRQMPRNIQEYLADEVTHPLGLKRMYGVDVLLVSAFIAAGAKAGTRRLCLLCTAIKNGNYAVAVVLLKHGADACSAIQSASGHPFVKATLISMCLANKTRRHARVLVWRAKRVYHLHK